MNAGELKQKLPEHLRERTRVVQDGATERRAGGSERGKRSSGANAGGTGVASGAEPLVLYWMRNAVRGEENPALDVARSWAADLGLPLLVYHGLDERYEFASDRHHRFILEGARDVQRELAAGGLSYACHLARPGDREPHLVALADASAVVVTEEMPVDPPRRFLRRLQLRTTAPIVTVDTACLVPMQLTQRAITRAFEFRSATEKWRQARLRTPWPVSQPAVRSVSVGRLVEEFGLRPIELQTADLADLVAECEIDHTVPPVPDTPGGATAGYQRWSRFRETGLRHYDRRRNDALEAGVSRLSAYLHYGMVSPLRIAREAAEIRSAGSEKFLDELLVWRELAYHFCFHRPDHDQLTALPDWALATLRAHQADHREALYDWETLARGETADRFWNAAQKSLIRQGELHNNVRMTWGKALLNWTATAGDALRLIIDLNHRYALDGRDPASYGGILWCLGQFDRPFEPARPILGTVRPRPTEEHARRLDPVAYLAQVTKPRFHPQPAVAVIGAGVAGLVAARTLREQGLPVTVLEKSRGVGGRMATRHLEELGSCDLGVPCFEAGDPRFIRYLNAWIEQGIVARWPQRSETHVRIDPGATAPLIPETASYVGTPQMNSICKHLAGGIEIRKQVRVQRVRPSGEQWELVDDAGQSLGNFDYVISTAPAGQSGELFAEFPQLAQPAQAVEMELGWACLATWPHNLDFSWELAEVSNSWLVRAARNHTKPGRNPSREQLVLHADSRWTAEHWESDPEKVANLMLAEFQTASGRSLPAPGQLLAHRWKFAKPSEKRLVPPFPGRCLTTARDRLICCGDWTSGPGVEAAFLAGAAAAGRVLNRLQPALPVNSRPTQARLF